MNTPPILKITRFTYVIAVTIAVLFCKSDSQAATRALNSSGGYRALLISENSNGLSSLRESFDKRYGFHACIAQANNSLPREVQGWVNTIKDDAVVTLVHYEGPANIENDELLLGRLSLQMLIDETARTGAKEVLLSLDIPALDLTNSEFMETLAKDFANRRTSNASTAVIHVLANLRSGGTTAREILCREFSRGADINSGPDLTFAALQERLSTSGIAMLSSAETQSPRSLVRRRPFKVSETIEELASAIATQLHHKKINVVAVPDVILKHGFEIPEDVPGQNYGELLRKSANQLRKELAGRSRFQYKVLGDDWFRDILSTVRVTPAEISGPALLDVYQQMKTAKLPTANAGEPVAVVIVELQHDPQNPAEVVLISTVWSVPDGTPLLNEFRGIAILGPSEWGETGYSGLNRVTLNKFTSGEEFAPIPPPNQQKKNNRFNIQPLDELDFFNPDDVQKNLTEINQLAQTAEHPLLDVHFPFRISMTSKGLKKALRFSEDRKHAFVDVQAGDTYELHIQNDSAYPVFMRLLVDGLNTLPDRPLTKREGIFEVAEKDERAPLQKAQIVSLTNARAWFCEPGHYQVNGFFTHIGENKVADVAEFVVTDAANSAAWAKGYPKDIGIITAAFYAPLEKPQDLAPDDRLGTRLGKEVQEQVKFYRGNHVPGELLGVIHLRYGVTGIVETLTRSQQASNP